MNGASSLVLLRDSLLWWLKLGSTVVCLGALWSNCRFLLYLHRHRAVVGDTAAFLSSR